LPVVKPAVTGEEAEKSEKPDLSPYNRSIV